MCEDKNTIGNYDFLKNLINYTFIVIHLIYTFNDKYEFCVTETIPIELWSDMSINGRRWSITDYRNGHNVQAWGLTDKNKFIISELYSEDASISNIKIHVKGII